MCLAQTSLESTFKFYTVLVRKILDEQKFQKFYFQTLFLSKLKFLEFFLQVMYVSCSDIFGSTLGSVFFA